MNANPDSWVSSINTRLTDGGFLTIAELCRLKSTSKSTVYLDIKDGLLPITKFGTATRVAGPNARDYIPRRGIVKKTEAA